MSGPEMDSAMAESRLCGGRDVSRLRWPILPWFAWGQQSTVVPFRRLLLGWRMRSPLQPFRSGSLL